MKDLMNSEEANIGGIFSLAATGFIKIYEWLTFDDINNFLQFVLAIGGAVFLYHRIKRSNIRQQNKKEAKRVRKLFRHFSVIVLRSSKRAVFLYVITILVTTLCFIYITYETSSLYWLNF